MPQSIAPEIGRMSTRALGAVAVEHGEVSDSPLPAVEEGGGQMTESDKAQRVNITCTWNKSPPLLKRTQGRTAGVRRYPET